MLLANVSWISFLAFRYFTAWPELEPISLTTLHSSCLGVQSLDFRVTTFSRSTLRRAGINNIFIRQRILDYFVLYHSRMTSFINRSLSAVSIFSHFKCDAEWYYVTPQYERRIRDFLGVSSLSHGFARALPYPAMERRIEIFLVGSRPTLGEYF